MTLTCYALRTKKPLYCRNMHYGKRGAYKIIDTGLSFNERILFDLFDHLSATDFV